MPNIPHADPLETLGNIAKDAVKETLQEPGKVLETAGGQTGLAVDPGMEKMAGQGQSQVPTFQQAQQKAQQQTQNKKRLTWLEDELKGLQKQKENQETQEKQEDKGKEVKQLQMEEQKKVEPIPIPLSVRNAKQRGGTKEMQKKIGG